MLVKLQDITTLEERDTRKGPATEPKSVTYVYALMLKLYMKSVTLLSLPLPFLCRSQVCRCLRPLKPIPLRLALVQWMVVGSVGN